MTYDEAIAFWFGRINYEVRAAGPLDLKLERTRALLRLLGDPHERLRIVHVTGTKGKGSTAAMIAAVLRAAGYRVGLFTSPHLVNVEERIQVDGVPISRLELASCMTEVAAAVGRLEAGPWPAPTFFEMSTALGFLHFVRRRCDVVVLEVGLGGRFDSTNVCNPLVSVITSVGFDHMAQLGNTLEEIAFQKAGIIKRGVPTVSGVTAETVAAVIEKVAVEMDSPVWRLDRDFEFEYEARMAEPLSTVVVRTSSDKHGPFAVGLLGEHQGANAAVAVATLDRLRMTGMPIPQAAFTKGLRNVHWPARIEIVSQRPTVILDCAHNIPSVEALVRTLQQSVHTAGKKRLIFAVSSDKQYAPMLAMLAGYFDHIYLTRYGNNPRCVPPERLAELLTSDNAIASFSMHPAAESAWSTAIADATPDDLLCITGSVFLAGELSAIVRTGG